MGIEIPDVHWGKASPFCATGVVKTRIVQSVDQSCQLQAHAPRFGPFSVWRVRPFSAMLQHCADVLFNAYVVMYWIVIIMYTK